MNEQIHIGTLAKKSCTGITYIWTSNDGGKTYWSGFWYNRTPRQLKDEAESVLRDLRTSHPRLFNDR